MTDQQPDLAAKALAFATGLRKNVLAAGRRWSLWPGGADDLTLVVARIEDVQARITAARLTTEADAAAAAAIADLRAILEWTTYQSASIATARALLVARKTRTFAERFGLLENVDASLAVLVESEASLIENVRTKNGYMIELAARHPQLALPRPLVNLASLTQRERPPAGRLVFMQQLIKSTKRTPR